MKNTARGTNAYLDLLTEMRGVFILSGAVSAVINVLMLTGPIYMLQIYDQVLQSESVSNLLILFSFVSILFLFLGISILIRSRLLSRVGYRVDHVLCDDALGQWLSSSSDQASTRLNALRELRVVRGFFQGSAIHGIFDFPWIPLYLLIVFVIHPLLGALTLVGAAVIVMAKVSNEKASRADDVQAMDLTATEDDLVIEGRANARIIKSMGMEKAIRTRWRELHDVAVTSMRRSQRRSESAFAFSHSFRMYLQSALLTLGAYLAIRQEISIGSIVAASVIAGRALAPIDQVIGQWRWIARSVEAHRRLVAIFGGLRIDQPARRTGTPKATLDVVDVVKFARSEDADEGRAPLLDGISFSMSPGDGLGVIGPTASGKSSLARILVGVWQPDAGEVRLGGASLSDWCQQDLGRNIGYMPQEVELLSGSVAENICRFQPDPDEEKIVEAAMLTGIHGAIQGLRNGYDTRVGGRATVFSAGQIQQVGLARAIFGAPRLIVLDEPNARLDAEGDACLSNAVAKMRQGGSAVVVMAHRPSAITSLNRVIVLQKGKVVQCGRKEAVLEYASTRPRALETPI